MIKDSSKLIKGQILKVDLSKIKGRLPKELILKLRQCPTGKLVGYKMVDGNQFGLVINLDIGIR